MLLTWRAAQKELVQGSIFIDRETRARCIAYAKDHGQTLHEFYLSAVELYLSVLDQMGEDTRATIDFDLESED